MKVMILAAGRGERMRPLTDNTPKPLLIAGGKSLIEHTITSLVAAGFVDIVINHAAMGQQIEHKLGNGVALGANIVYSPEGDEALETAGGIINALTLLGNEPFLVVNGDIATDFPFALLKNTPIDLAHIILVENPLHNQNGDFGLLESGQVINNSQQAYTFSGIGIYHPDLFSGVHKGKHKLGVVLRDAISKQRVSGEMFSGFWMDVGTPQRLQEFDAYLASNNIN
jgi:MurNAc alpha-1-phosphate uridylyltransferase